MNPTGQTQCEKCQTVFAKDGGTPPPPPPAAPPSPPRPAAPPVGGSAPFAAGTVMGKQANLPAWDEAMSPTPKVPSSAPVPPAAAAQTPPREARPTVDQGRKQAQGNDMNECPNASCGYPNSSKSKFCVACGTPLKGTSSPAPMIGDRPTERGEQPIKQPAPPGSTKKQMMLEEDDDAVMPAPVSKPKPQRQAASPNVNATVNPWSKKKEATFTLRPVMREGESPRPDVEFEGDAVEVNRSTLDPSNTTITGKVQALFEYRDGSWFLTNKSALQTTFVRVDAPLQLKKGDVILMGDRLFEFDE